MKTPSENRRTWLMIALFIGFLILSLFPLIAQKPFPPQDTPSVILNLLMVADLPYAGFAPILHVATLILIGLILRQPGRWGRLLASYIGANYLLLTVTCAMGRTETYGFVVMTGALILYAVLGILWLAAAFRNSLRATFRKPTLMEWGLIALAVLAFWAPYSVSGGAVQPWFNPLLLLTAPDYGMTFCFTTPVLLMILILCAPDVPPLAFRITAINGFVYALFNLPHWFYPERWWMGALHLPLLIISLYAIFHKRVGRPENVPAAIPSR
jgi:hypothetical protein